MDKFVISLKRGFGYELSHYYKKSRIINKKKMFLALGTGDSSLSGGKLKKCKMVSVFT